MLVVASCVLSAIVGDNNVVALGFSPSVVHMRRRRDNDRRMATVGQVGCHRSLFFLFFSSVPWRKLGPFLYVSLWHLLSMMLSSWFYLPRLVLSALFVSRVSHSLWWTM